MIAQIIIFYLMEDVSINVPLAMYNTELIVKKSFLALDIMLYLFF